MASKSTKDKTKRTPAKTKKSDDAADSPSELVEDGMTPDTEVPPDPGYDFSPARDKVEEMESDLKMVPPLPESPTEPETDESKPDLPSPPRLPRIHLRVFEKVAGVKWDQFAGFKAHAKSNKLGPMTIPEWREAFQTYRDKPIS